MKKTKMIPLAIALLSSAFLSAAESEFPKCDNANAIISKLQEKGAGVLIKLKRQQSSWVAIDTKNKHFSVQCIPYGSNKNKAETKSEKNLPTKLPLLQMIAKIKMNDNEKFKSIEFRNNQYLVVLEDNGVEINQYYSPEGKLKSWVIVD